MKLIKIEIERLNHTNIEHRLVETQEEIDNIKNELEATKKDLYSTNGFVGYYSYYVEEIDIESITDISELHISLKDLKRLLNSID